MIDHSTQPVRRSAGPLRTVRIALSALGLAGLGACSSGAVPTFDLTAPRQVSAGGLSGQLVVVEPAALQPLEAERILAKDKAGTVSYLAGAQWSDRLPRLIQTKLIQTFENASRLKAVGRPGDGTTPNYQLTTEIRAFQLDAAAGTAFAEISAKLIDVKAGRTIAGKVFSARIPVSSPNGPEVAQALDRALSRILVEIVRWAGATR